MVYANGIFSFNPEIKVVTDVGLFEELCDSIEMENTKSGIGCMSCRRTVFRESSATGCPIIFIFIPSITYHQGSYFRLAGRYIERQTELASMSMRTRRPKPHWPLTRSTVA